MKFADLRLAEPILRAVAAEGYSDATPIQALTIPHVIDGRDVLGCAQTGTGKTAAFALPVLHRLSEKRVNKGKNTLPRCLVLSPTRELAQQIAESFKTYGTNLPISGTVIYGGVSQYHQVKDLQRGLDVIVATPGRLLDLINQGYVDLSFIETLVLDEADRMLDMGFIHDIRKIVSYVPERRQTLLFSATMPREIRSLAESLLNDPATVEIEPETKTVDKIEQSVYFVSRRNKPELLSHFLENTSVSRAIVFTRTKHGADRVTKHLRQRNVAAEAIHGNKTQNARQRALSNFTDGRTHVLVATDIAARGIDVDGISHVINYDLTHEPETYVHRIGRTARAGASGHAISFCDHDEHGNLVRIQKLIRQNITIGEEIPDLTMPESSIRSGAGNGGSGKGNGRSKNGRPSRQASDGNDRNGQPRRRNQVQNAKGGQPRNGGGGGPRRNRRRSKPKSV